LQLECCGVKSYLDFQDQFNKDAPGSCCDRNDNATCDPFTTNVKDRPGCGKILEDLFKSACAILGGISLGTAAIEVNIDVRAYKKNMKLKNFIYIYIKFIY